jgi:hypothetical protein
MSRLIRWLTPLLLVANAALLAVNFRNWSQNERVAAMNREITEQLPSHACRPVILPGEKCTATLKFHLPADRGSL